MEEVPEVEAVDDVLLEDESVPVVLLTTPLDSRACMIAAMRPPPGGGAPVELAALLSLPELPEVEDVELKYTDGSHCRELELPSELTLMLRDSLGE